MQSVSSTVDVRAFGRDLDALRAEIDASLCEDDWRHLRRFEWVARLCVAAGYATAWMAPNPLSVLLLSTGTFVLWAVLMHHVGHRGYDRVPGAPRRYSSKVYAQGGRRFIDWLDWMPTDAWIHEHNALHHARTNEEADPDLVVRNTEGVRTVPGPLFLKYAIIAFFSVTWKFTYYMPGTIRALQLARDRRRRQPRPADSPQGLREFYSIGSAGGRAQWRRLVDPRGPDGREFWLRGALPYAGVRFVVLPLLFLPLGTHAALSVLLNSLLAEALTNLHAFVTIVPNHAGDDIPIFESQAGDRAEYYFRQVIGAVNYDSPGAWSDFLQGGLNFQIEHHLWPDLPLSRYRACAPRVRAICERHGVPYKQEHLARRCLKLIDIMVGRATPPVVETSGAMVRAA
jgi:fatty acid desaturase